MWQCLSQIEFALGTCRTRCSSWEGAKFVTVHLKCQELLKYVSATSEQMRLILEGTELRLPAALFWLATQSRSLDTVAQVSYPEMTDAVMAWSIMLGRTQQLSASTAEMAWCITSFMQKI